MRCRSVHFAALLILAAALLAPDASAVELHGRVVGITDGDTLPTATGRCASWCAITTAPGARSGGCGSGRST